MTINSKMNNPLLVISCLKTGFELLTKTQLRKYVLIPVLINIVLYALGFSLSYVYLSELINQFIPDWLNWLRWLLWPIFFISFLMLMFFSFTLLANLLASPFYGKLSEQALGIISGTPPMIHDQPIVKVLLGELHRLMYLGIRCLPLLVISIIPGINIVAPVLWGIFAAWGIAMEYFSYPLENSGLVFKDQLVQLKTIRWGVLGLGGFAMLALSVPILNLFVSSATVIAATAYWYQINGGEVQQH